MTTSTIESDRADDSQPTGVVFLDFDDALIFGSTWRLLHQQFEVVEKADEHYDMFANGEIAFSEWGHLDAGLWEGTPVDELPRAAANVERIAGIDPTIRRLRADGYVVGIVSGGIRQLIAAILNGHELDFLIANELTIDDGVITGAIEMAVTPQTKPEIFDRIASEHSVPLARTIAVGNSADDFQRDLRGLQIGLNPSTDRTRDRADRIVEGDSIEPVLPIIQEWADGT